MERKQIMSSYSKLACFVGGALFGSVGLKLLTSKDAKNAYVHVAAADLNAERAAKEAAAEAAAQVIDEAEEKAEEAFDADAEI